MPEVVCDTSSLQYLHQVDRLEVLRHLYGTILIPEGVAEELATGRSLGHSLPDPAKITWIRTVVVPNRKVLLMATRLGQGEREVLSLAASRPDAVAILDDSLARRLAEPLGVPFTGTLGVLLKAKRQGLVPRVGPIIDRLEALGFRLDSGTRGSVLDLAGES